MIEDPGCSRCHRSVNVDPEHEWHEGDVCWPCQGAEIDSLRTQLHDHDAEHARVVESWLKEETAWIEKEKEIIGELTEIDETMAGREYGGAVAIIEDFYHTMEALPECYDTDDLVVSVAVASIVAELDKARALVLRTNTKRAWAVSAATKHLAEVRSLTMILRDSIDEHAAIEQLTAELVKSADLLASDEIGSVGWMRTAGAWLARYVTVADHQPRQDDAPAESEQRDE
ncbi:MAG TPA: hypothetical protein ENH33_00605 [Actinobacteria bacterium]|nr:hypothetical protein [Actinomycetota bacterium]